MIPSRSMMAALLAGTVLAAPLWAQQTHPETGETLADEQVFVYRELDESPSIDPQKVEDVSGSTIARSLFEGLLNQDETGELEPGVATEWSASDESKTWTFTCATTPGGRTAIRCRPATSSSPGAAPPTPRPPRPTPGTSS